MRCHLLILLVFLLHTACTSQPSQQTITEKQEVVHRLAELGPAKMDASVHGQEIELANTVQGITVTINWIYADQNRVFVAYSVDNPIGWDFRPTRTTLTTEEDIAFKWKSEFGVTGPSDLLDVVLQPEDGAYLPEFEMIDLPSEEGALDVRFQVVLEQAPLIPPPEPQAIIDRIADWLGLRRMATPEKIVIEAEVIKPMPQVGPFTFEFFLPIE